MTNLDAQHLAFRQQLFDHKLLFDSGARGVVGRSPQIAALVRGLHQKIDAITAQDFAAKVSFPPVIPRELVRKVGYMDNFPHLCGSVHAFTGNEKAHLSLQKAVNNGEDWSSHLTQSEVTLTPAACYPLYPTLTGTCPENGLLFDLGCYCFRHEPSNDPARLISFEMRENVRVGSANDVQVWRSNWIERGESFVSALGLSAKLDVASDPFFGRGGRMMEVNQKAQELKFELLANIWGEENPTAVLSFNYHQTHFGHLFDIKLNNGEEAHTACIAFGIDRLVVALLKTHGFDLNAWPASVRTELGL